MDGVYKVGNSSEIVYELRVIFINSRKTYFEINIDVISLKNAKLIFVLFKMTIKKGFVICLLTILVIKWLLFYDLFFGFSTKISAFSESKIIPCHTKINAKLILSFWNVKKRIVVLHNCSYLLKVVYILEKKKLNNISNREPFITFGKLSKGARVHGIE